MTSLNIRSEFCRIVKKCSHVIYFYVMKCDKRKSIWGLERSTLCKTKAKYSLLNLYCSAVKCLSKVSHETFSIKSVLDIPLPPITFCYFVMKGYLSCFGVFFVRLQLIASQSLERQMRHNCSMLERSALRSAASVRWIGLHKRCGQVKHCHSRSDSDPPQVFEGSSFIFHFSISKSKINLRVLTMFLHRRKVMFTS